MDVITKLPSTTHFLTITLTFLILISHVHQTSGLMRPRSSTSTPSKTAAAIQGTNNCSAVVSKLSRTKGIGRKEARALKGCVGDLKDAVSELRETTAAMGHLGDADREFQWATAKTHASAAITDAETCVDEVLEMKVKAAVKKKIKSCVDGVEKLMSNALSLINHLY